MDLLQSSGTDTSTSTTVEWQTHKQTSDSKFKFSLFWDGGGYAYGAYDTDVLAIAGKDAEIASRFGP